jgi:beta-N-acetylhexosaminidase
MTTALVARAQGSATGHYLKSFGINTDLAPVLDVPTTGRSFIAPRTFGRNAASVTNRGVAFAQGLQTAGVAATAKHFPGLGAATIDTDSAPSVVAASKVALMRNLAPFSAAIKAGIQLVMVSTAIYPNLGDDLPAACSRTVVSDLLRSTLGFQGAVVSDDLGTRGVMTVVPLDHAVVDAAQAGVDLLYVAGPSGANADTLSKKAYESLLVAAQRGGITRTDLQRSYARILALKAVLRRQR